MPVIQKVVNPQREAMMALGDQIAEEATHLDAAMHRLLTDVRNFDAGSGWHHAGAQSCAHWLSWRVGWDLATGREHVRVARRLGELPRIDEALRTGKLSYAKVRAITRVATAKTEEALLIDALATTAAQLEIICRKFRTVQRLARAEPAEIEQSRTVVRRALEDGMVRIEVTLRPDEAAIVMAAFDREAKELARGRGQDGGPAGNASAETPRPRFNRADAVMAIAQRTLRGDAPTKSPVEVLVTVPRAALAKPVDGDDRGIESVGVFSDGTCVSAQTCRRLTCDAGVVEIVEDEHGMPLSVGRKTRTMPASLMRALLKRDEHCRFPGCSNRVYVEGHHIVHWAQGGETSLQNACLLCSWHHTFVHEHGYRIELTDGEPAFFDPRGRRVPLQPPRPASDADRAWGRMRAANDELGITSQTGLCRWDGQAIQYDLVIGDLGYLEGLR